MDPRVEDCYVVLNGQNYHYLLANPTTPPRATIFLIHGWPDFSYGWRRQIPYLLSLNLRVVVPDMMGYGQTSAPMPLEYYTFKRASDDLAALAKHLNAPNIILLGHDWGGMIVYRMALWHPSLITGVISVCTPYQRPSPTYISLETMVSSGVPNFQYQIQLASGEVEQKIQGKEQIKQFLNALYGGHTTDYKSGFVPEKGALFENLPDLQRSKLLTEEELDTYATAYAWNGMRGTLNWYRTRKLNFEDEMVLAKDKDLKIRVPTLFILATRDVALPPRMSKGMEKNFTDLRVREVNSGHWALIQQPEVCNGFIGEFLEPLLVGSEQKAKL